MANMMTLYKMLYLIDVGTVVTVVSGAETVVRPTAVELIPFVDIAPLQAAPVIGLAASGNALTVRIRKEG